MFISVSKNIDWDAIWERKKKAIEKNNKQENTKQINHTFQKGDWILIKKPGIIHKLAVPGLGPYKVIKHHNNGTITYEKEPFITDRINIRRVDPYYWRNCAPNETE